MPLVSPQISEKIFSAINKADNILLVSHINPDGDSLGSILGFYQFLKKNNKNATMYVADNLPEDFNFLPNFYKIKNNFTSLNQENFSLLIYLDCGEYSRSGLENYQNRFAHLPSINIDHHHSNNNFGTINLVLPNFSSTAEIIYSLFKQAKFAIDNQIATCLLAGILTDTNFFVYSNSSSQTLNTASQLLQLGGKTKAVLENIYPGLSFKSLKLYGKAMARLTIDSTTNLATTAIFLDDLEEARATEEELVGLNDYLNKIYDVKGTCVLKEHSSSLVKGSLRTMRDDVDVSAIARNYGGGGHKKAAGFKINGKIVKTEVGEWKVEKK